jgi:hypothetical protein
MDSSLPFYLFASYLCFVLKLNYLYSAEVRPMYRQEAGMNDEKEYATVIRSLDLRPFNQAHKG